ncbi:MAG: hypothetical protein AAB864_02530, partial [Patescibacteria group bacterium]
GNVQHKTDDMAYATNLIAALAKREYYHDPDVTPKEAFTAMLRKANEVVEEFFKHEGLVINVGIFAVAGEKISISKLGKFKMYLAREGKTVDVLNNIELFGKEHLTENRFSSVLNGSVQDGDRLFAFYPSRVVAAREKSFREFLPKLAANEFIEKLNDIKTQKNTFTCAGIYVDFQKIKEVAVEPNIQPQELAPEAPVSKPVLASEPKPKTPSSPIPAARPAVSPQEMPRIIPSEFSLGKKGNIVGTIMHGLRLIRMTPQARAVGLLALVALVVVGVLVFQSSSFINPQARAVKEAVTEAQTQLDLAKNRIGQNDLAEARTILNASLATLRSFDAQNSDNIIEVQNETVATLNDIDQAEQAHTTAVTAVPSELGAASLLGASDASLALYGQSTASSSPYLATLVNDAVQTKSDVDIDADSVMTEGAAVLAMNHESKQYAVHKKEKTKTFALETASPLIATAYYKDNLYILFADDIFKIPDASQGPKDGQSWLKKGTELPDDLALITVDGNIYVLTSNGTLVTYYQGEKVRESATHLVPSAQTRLLATNDESADLYLADRAAGRIYVIDKRTGALAKTLIFDADIVIRDVAITTTNVLYLLTDKGEILKVE